MRISDWSSDVCSSDLVQDDDQPIAGRFRIVHCLIGHASRHGAIAYDGNGLVRPVRKFVGNSKAQCGADRCGAMGCTERIICALGALGEPGKPTPLPQGADAVAPSCKHFMRIALWADRESV